MYVLLSTVVSAKLPAFPLRNVHARGAAGEHHTPRARPKAHDSVRRREGRASQAIVSSSAETLLALEMVCLTHSRVSLNVNSRAKESQLPKI